MASHTASVMSLASDVKSGPAKISDKAIDELIQLLNPRNRNANLADLGDKSYHQIFESLFSCAIREKPIIYDKRKKDSARNAATTRLEKCASAVRMAAARGAFKLGRKTLLALVDHITQVLPGPDDKFVPPLLQNYVKAFSEVLSRQSHVEYLARQDAMHWETCVDFLLDVTSYVLPAESHHAPRGSSASGTPTPRSTLLSSNSTQSQRRMSHIDGDTLRDALNGLKHLFSAGNAPVARRAKQVTDLTIRVLELTHLSLGAIQTLCFSLCNIIFSSVQADEVDYAKDLVKSLLPSMAFWWRAEKVSQDELIRGIRNEISITILLSHMHIKSLALHESSGIYEMLDSLLDPMWQEYSKRSEAFRLQLGDLAFSTTNSPNQSLGNRLFGLYPHNSDGEGRWAVVHSLALLEDILASRSPKHAQYAEAVEGRPRKRQRTSNDMVRMRRNIKSPDTGLRRTALQVMSFLLARTIPSDSVVSSLAEDLSACASSKDPVTSSWAMIAAACCVPCSPTSDVINQGFWKQLWHLAMRTVGVQSTSSAACLLLHRILESNVLPHSMVSEDVDSIVTTADVNGPGVLCDTSLALMLHLFYVRTTRVPSASQATCNHVIRWTFLKWNPSELAFSSSASALTQPQNIVNVMRACSGALPLTSGVQWAISGTGVRESWAKHLEMRSFLEYLLLLGDEGNDRLSTECLYSSASQNYLHSVSDAKSFFTSRKLIFELFYAKLEELSELCQSWGKRPSEGGLQMSLDRFRCLLYACVVGALMLPQFADLNTSQSASVESQIMALAESSVRLALDSVEPLDFEQLIIQSLRPCIPAISTSSLTQFQSECPGLLRLLNRISVLLDQKSPALQFGTNADLMDLDDEFDSQSSRVTTSSAPIPLPRLNAQLATSKRAFIVSTKERLALMRAIDNDNSQIGLLPDSWLAGLMALPDDDLLSCQDLLLETFRSDIVTTADNALQVVQRLGSIISAGDYQCCEVALTLCVDLIEGLHHTWLNDNQDLAESVGDLYNYFIKICLPLNVFSPRAQISLAGLLFTLLRVHPEYGSKLRLDSCRTTLLKLLSEGTMQVKCFVADRIAGIFELFILMLHDEVFVDVLASLPINPEDTSGIAFRLFTLSKLACRWPTLLRRCIYHIFETPGKIREAKEHARWCMVDIAKTLNLESPKTLFELFSRQLLYTWMENDSIQEIPYSIFGFEGLRDLLLSGQAEAIALAIMRGQDVTVAEIAKAMNVTETNLVQDNVAASLAYSMPFSDMTGTAKNMRGEDYIMRKLGGKGYTEAIYVNFVDTIATLFDLIDQEDNMSKMFRKHEELSYAAANLDAMSKLSHSAMKLPANQQPMFHAKFVMNSIFRLCQGTEHQFRDLWTPAVVLAITRSLLNTVHAALGSLHSCSVLRKVRLVVCLADKTALTSYCLEMLLNSVRGFIVDPECADDALGLSQYLLDGGALYLRQTPSFLAGYSLSTLASLRVFLESSQSSTTQESQFRATMSKAQKFHDWFSEYLSKYSSPMFRDDQQSELFKSITGAASKIRSSGNAEKGSAESKLLLDILKDGTSQVQLLNRSSKDLALKLLCGDFTIPASGEDIVASDASATHQAPRIWKSCEARHLSKSYLSWAGRAVGRAFAASGDIPEGVLQESQLNTYQLEAEEGGSEIGMLSLLQELTGEENSHVAGMAEAALRTIVSRAVLFEDEHMAVACQKGLPESLFLASQWTPFRSPQLELPSKGSQVPKWEDNLASKSWLKDTSSYLAHAVPDSVLLSALPKILSEVPELSVKAFPFLVHIVLRLQLDQQQKIKRQISAALKDWLKVPASQATENVKLLINAILYLRTQAYPNESSIADRSHWLDVDYALASSAASRCGMQKTALLFAELSASESSRSSRRSSTLKEDLHDTLLSIFESIDDPDTYYGLPEEASLSTVLARIEYENEGSKSLAFRGARYDTHLRLGRSEARQDGQALVRALGTLGLSGLSQSVLHSQQDIGAETGSTESTFHTARRLGLWNLPAPAERNHAVVLYQAYQSMHYAGSTADVQATLHAGFEGLMKDVVGANLNATALRSRLAALASLAELNDLLNVSEQSELDALLQKFKNHSQWMRRGIYGDVSQILSCRSTALSMLCQHAGLLNPSDISTDKLRRAQVESLIMSSGVYRYHQATQECLNISTELTEMIPICENLSLHVDAAIRIEVANSLWDHGEMSTSIRMLQAIDKDSSLQQQSIRVARSDLLSKIGHQVSLARLETPQDIQKTYLAPALKDLKRDGGAEAGTVYHQFATFCDTQLQDPDGLEDLARLQSLRKAKNDEVRDLKALIDSTKESQLKTRYSHVLSKEKQWLELDEKELRRVEQTRSEFVQLSLENYLLSLISSDEYNSDALRFTALWLERSAEETTNKAVMRHLPLVPTRKFATLMNQLTSRLQNQETLFQKLLYDLIFSICVDHPYHGMYQIWSGTKARAQQKDGIAVQRVKATEKVAQRLMATKSVADVWVSIDKTSKYYHGLAMDRDTSKYKSGAKFPLKESTAGQYLVNCLARYRIPPPTLQIEVSATKDYSHVPYIAKLEPTMTIAGGVSAPKIITAIGSDGSKYKQLVKGGHDDLRQDAIMEQVFVAVSSLLKLHRSTQQRNLGIRTYKVLPLTASSGIIEFVSNTVPLHDFLMPAHERYYPRDLKGSQCRKEIFNVQNRTVETRLNTYRKVTERFHPVMRYFFMEYFVDPDEWFARRLAYTRSTAAISMLGHILGLGDRHGHNILLDSKTGDAVHIDLGVAFEAGRILPVPELVPFRLTRDIVDGMGITKTEGVFRRCCEFTLDALREEQYAIMTILDVLRYDPLYTWSISPLRLAKLQKARQEDGEESEAATAEAKKQGPLNEPSEADRALEIVRKKLSKTLSVTATVNELINQATDERNLAVLYSGWAAYA